MMGILTGNAIATQASIKIELCAKCRFTHTKACSSQHHKTVRVSCDTGGQVLCKKGIRDGLRPGRCGSRQQAGSRAADRAWACARGRVRTRVPRREEPRIWLRAAWQRRRWAELGLALLSVNQRAKGNSAMSAWHCHGRGSKARELRGPKQAGLRFISKQFVFINT